MHNRILYSHIPLDSGSSDLRLQNHGLAETQGVPEGEAGVRAGLQDPVIQPRREW